VLQFVFHFPVG